MATQAESAAIHERFTIRPATEDDLPSIIFMVQVRVVD